MVLYEVIGAKELFEFSSYWSYSKTLPYL